MSNPPNDSATSLLERCEAMLALVDRLAKWQIAVIVATAGGVLWGARLEFKSADHESRLTKLESHDEKLGDLVQSLRSDGALLRQMVESMKSHGASNTNKVDVKVGAMAKDEFEKTAKARGYYVASDVASILNRSERWVTDKCAKNEINGAYKEGREWRFPLGIFLLGMSTEDDLRISGNLPQTAAVSGKQPQTPQP